VTQRVGRGIALLFHDRGTRRGWVVSVTPRPHLTPGEDPVPILQEAGLAPGPVWKGGKSRPHRDSIPDRPARSQSLYRLSYRAHEVKYCREIKGAAWENKWRCKEIRHCEGGLLVSYPSLILFASSKTLQRARRMDGCRLAHIVMKYQPAGKSNTERPPVDCYVETGTGHVACHWKRDDDDDDDDEDNGIDSWFAWRLPHFLTHSMDQSPSWEANRFLAGQEIPRILCNPKVHDPQSQQASGHWDRHTETFRSYFNINFNIVCKAITCAFVGE